MATMEDDEAEEDDDEVRERERAVVKSEFKDPIERDLVERTPVEVVVVGTGRAAPLRWVDAG